MVSYYQGDNNITIKEIQDAIFPNLGALLFSVPAMHYMEAARFIGVTTELYIKIRTVLWEKGFRINALREPYNHLAAWYRRFNDDFGQLRLPFDSSTEYINYHRDEWCRIFHQELKIICDQVDVAHLLIRAVVNDGSEDGESAIQELKLFMLSAYSLEREQSVKPESLDKEDAE